MTLRKKFFRKIVTLSAVFMITDPSIAIRFTDLVITDNHPSNVKYVSLKQLESIANDVNTKYELGVGKSTEASLTATLIHPRVAITAAHCIGGAERAETLKGKKITFYGQTVSILNIIIRANSGIDNRDIALIELGKPITAGNPVEIYKGSIDDLEDQWLLALSYGPIVSQDEKNPIPTGSGGILHLARSHFRKAYRQEVLDVNGESETFPLLTQYPDNDKNNLFRGVGVGGDSGSPLYCKVGNKYQLIGICSSVSHGYLETATKPSDYRAGYINLSDEYENFIKYNVDGI